MDGREAAIYLKVFSYWSLLQLAKENKVPHLKIGRRVFFRKDSLGAWLDSLETGGTAPQEEGQQYGKLRRVNP